MTDLHNKFKERCETAARCLPDAAYRAQLTALNGEMLAEIEALAARIQEVGEMMRENRSRRVVELETALREALAKPDVPEGTKVDPSKWDGLGFTQRQIDWLVEYERETFIEPMTDDMNTFREIYQRNLKWWEDHSGDIHHRLWCLDESQIDAAPQPKDTQ